MQPERNPAEEPAPSALASPGAEGPGRPGPPAPLRPDQEFQAFLGRGVQLRGNASFAGRLRIEGQFEGEIQGGELLVVASPAEVRGTLRARRVIVLGGQIEADIFAEESIELRVPARVAGHLTAPEIFLDRGVDFRGQCSMRSAPAEV